jgi:aminoglycoside phosphotransferase (APT) family kinase protein
MKLQKVIAVRTSKTVYRDGDLAIKVFDEDYSKADVLNEALNQARVEVTDLPIPKVIEVTKVNGKWAIVTEFIQGKTLWRLMTENPEKVDEYLERFVDIQLEIQSKRVPMLNTIFEKMHRKITQSGLDATTRYELHTRLESMPKHKKVCHGDFNPSNVIVSENDEAYIIDWAHVTQGNASADAARTYLLFRLEGEDEMAEKYLKLFCDKGDTAKQSIQKWLPIVAASQLVKEKPEQKEFLLRWTAVVDYE